jgi:xanthine dehydrogenase large subunit
MGRSRPRLAARCVCQRPGVCRRPGDCLRRGGEPGLLARVQLWSDGFYATPGLSWDRRRCKGQPFHYFAYGAAVSEVVVDTLTGEFKLLRADMLHDAGRSLNPAIDIGQVEGAFIQGMGWLTMRRAGLAPGRRLGRLLPRTHPAPTRSPPPTTARRCFTRAAVRQAQRARQHPPQQGGGRAAAAAAVFGVLGDPRRGLGRGRPPRRPAAAAPATPEAILRAITAAQAAA